MRATLPFHGLRVVCMLGLVVGCAAPTDPALRSLTGTFVLQSVGGKAVPLLQLEYTYTRQYLVTDTLTADGRGHYERVQITEIDSVGNDYRTTQRRAWTGTYTIHDDRVDFPFVCPFGALCIAPPVGWRQADGSLVIDGPQGNMRFIQWSPSG